MYRDEGSGLVFARRFADVVADVVDARLEVCYGGVATEAGVRGGLVGGGKDRVDTTSLGIEEGAAVLRAGGKLAKGDDFRHERTHLKHGGETLGSILVESTK